METVCKIKENYIDVSELSHFYLMGDLTVKVLNDITFQIKESEFVSILGPSGCGKTTLLNLLGGLERISKGTVVVGGKDISLLGNNDLCNYRRHTVGFIFQFYNLFPHLTVIENVKAGIEILALDRNEISSRANEYLEKVGLSNKKNRFPSQLSGGEQQRVAIARALAKKSRLILADEPTGNLDQSTGKGIIDLFKQIHKSTEASIVMITHDWTVAENADRVMNLFDGKLV